MFLFFAFFFTDTATTELYTLSLHDALPISFFAGAPFLPLTTGASANMSPDGSEMLRCRARRSTNWRATTSSIDRKSTRLNSSHGYISYAVFCLKKKKKTNKQSLYDINNIDA